jgi:hypothetical protein
VYSKKIGMALSVDFIDPTTKLTTSSRIFSSDIDLSNVTVPYCSYYTSAENFSARPTPNAFLQYVNFPNVYSSIQSALGNTNTLLFSNQTIQPNKNLSAFLNKLDTQVLKLGYISNCVTEKPDLTEKLFAVNKDLEVSKERYDDTNSPETNVSNYEGTFPIYKPLKTTSLLGLFAGGIFLMLLTVLIFMRMQGIELNFILPDKLTIPGVSALPGSTDALSNTVTSFFANNTTLILFACAAGGFAGYLYNRFHREWTS